MFKEVTGEEASRRTRPLCNDYERYGIFKEIFLNRAENTMAVDCPLCSDLSRTRQSSFLSTTLLTR